MSPTAQVDVVVLQHMLNFWDSQGIDIEPIWRVLKLDPTQPLPRWIAAARLTDVYLFLSDQGHDLGLLVSAGRYLAQQELPVGRLLRHGSSLEQALPLCFRFAYLTVGSIDFVIENNVTGKRVVVRSQTSCSSLQHQLLLALATLTHACAEVLGPDCAASGLRVCLPAELLNDDHVCQGIALPMQADHRFALEISHSAWQRNNPYQKAELFRHALREFEREHQKFSDYLALYEELKSILQQCLLQRHVSQEDVAESLGISVRNLQRRLKALGTNYQSLLDEARKALALRLLQDEATPLYEVSFMVGYNEPSAFYKAFKRWAGMTPGDYRLALSQPVTELPS